MKRSKMIRGVLLIVAMLFVASIANAEGIHKFNEYGIREGIDEFIFREEARGNSWEILPSKKDIPVNKTWDIEFNRSFNINDIDAMVIEKGNMFIPIRIELFSIGKYAQITPIDSLLPNSNYTIKIVLNNGRRYKLEFETERSINQMVGNVGNTGQNLANWGLVNEYKDWIFYVENFGLYRKDKYTGQIITLDVAEEYINNINIVGDGWVYYIKDNSIYRTRYSGEDSQRIVNGYSPHIQRMIVIDDIIYYTTGNMDKSGFNRVNTNGNDSKILDSLEVYSYESLQYGDKGIYYRDRYDQTQLYDGNKKFYVNNTDRMLKFQVVNDAIYYINEDKGGIYKTDLNGNNRQEISSVYAEELHVTEDGYVYYVDAEDRATYRMNTDGSNVGLFIQNTIEWINSTSDDLFYYDTIKKGWYMIGKNGKNMRPVGGASRNLESEELIEYLPDDENEIELIGIDEVNKEEDLEATKEIDSFIEKEN